MVIIQILSINLLVSRTEFTLSDIFLASPSQLSQNLKTLLLIKSVNNIEDEKLFFCPHFHFLWGQKISTLFICCKILLSFKTTM